MVRPWAELSFQHDNLISGLCELMSGDESSQTGTDDDDAPRLLRGSEGPFADSES